MCCTGPSVRYCLYRVLVKQLNQSWTSTTPWPYNKIMQCHQQSYENCSVSICMWHMCTQDPCILWNTCYLSLPDFLSLTKTKENPQKQFAHRIFDFQYAAVYVVTAVVHEVAALPVVPPADIRHCTISLLKHFFFLTASSVSLSAFECAQVHVCVSYMCACSFVCVRVCLSETWSWAVPMVSSSNNQSLASAHL